MGVEIDIDMQAVAKINAELAVIRKELEAYDAVKQIPKPFNPLTDTLPAEIDAEFDRAVKAAVEINEEALIEACHKIEAYFGFPKPNKVVQEAEVPGGMYTNMVAQLKALKNEDILPQAMALIPRVRLDAGLPPLVTPTSQIVGAQAVNCAMDIKNGKPMYTTKSIQFVNLVKGEYGHTPVKINPEFRMQIAGTREETPYDTSKYQMQPNPVLENCGGVKLAENEKEVLLLELFPLVAKDFLTKTKCEAHAAKQAEIEKAKSAEEAAKPKPEPITGQTVNAPLPGRVLQYLVKAGDKVKAGQDVFILEAMKMENNISSDYDGVVKRLLVETGTAVANDAPVVELE